jgi:endonuclease/exonuclease/phosphatase (EEP) superfamily protein YafD
MEAAVQSTDDTASDHERSPADSTVTTGKQQLANKSSRRASAAFAIAWWCLTLLGAIIAICTILAPHGWVFDLTAMLAGPIWYIVGSCCVVGAVIVRRWGHAGALLLSVLIVAWIGADDRRMMPYPMIATVAELQAHQKSEEQAVFTGQTRPIKIVQVNLYAKGNPVIPEALDALIALEADVVVMTEFPQVIWEQMRTATALSAAYPHMSSREWVKDRVPGCVVLTRWPVERIEPAERGVSYSPPDGTRGAREQDYEQVYLGRVESPWGKFVVAQITPQSPRSAARWARGNEITRAAAAVLETVVDQGETVALACDLNSTPFGVRGRVLRDTGLRPSKPVLLAGGSWPTGAPGFLRVAIDDVWVGGGARAVSWRLVELPGSDHLGVEVGLVLGTGSEELE